jgi:hypothetical protein
MSTTAMLVGVSCFLLDNLLGGDSFTSLVLRLSSDGANALVVATVIIKMHMFALMMVLRAIIITTI